MRKFYSLVLIAAGLLIGTNVWAEIHEGDVCKIGNEGYAKLATAIEAVPTTGVETTIELISDVTIADASDFNHIDARYSKKPKVIGIVGGRNVKVEMNGKSIRFECTTDISPIDKNTAVAAADAGTPYPTNAIVIDGGSLKITNSTNVLSTISYPNVKGITKMFNVYGTKDNVDQPNYSSLTIEKNIALTTSCDNGYYGVMIPANAYGVTINLDCQITSSAPCVYTNGSFQKTSVNVPQITIGENAVLVNTNDTNGSASIYAAGFAKWQINGSTIISSSAGVYIKGGQLTLDGVTIHATGEYKAPVENGNGFDANGSAIIVDSHKGYVKEDMSLTITGNTQITSAHGWAIEEVATKGSDKLPTVNLESGDFKGELGALTMTDEKQQDMVVKGTLTGGTYNSDIAPYVSNVDGVIYYEIVDGTTQWTIGKVSEEGWITDGTTTGENIKLENTEATTEGDEEAGYVFLKENSTLTVKEGTTYTVEQLVVDNTSNVVVEKGGTLLITGDNGIISTNTDNIVVHAEDGNNGAMLINPEVTFNTTPMATVEFVSKSYRNSNDDKAFQRFGIPSGVALDEFTFNGDPSIQTAISSFNYSANKWELVGILNDGLVASQLNQPFGYYQMLTNAPYNEDGYKFTMKGKLVGNENPAITIWGDSWFGLANSYVGKMDIEAILAAIPSTVQPSVYSYRQTGDGAYNWEPINYSNVGDTDDEYGVENFYSKIEPMQAFLVWNPGAPVTIQFDYTNMVWKPVVNPSSAPARKSQRANWTKVKVRIVDETGMSDVVTLVESDQFSAMIDNGYESRKYMNDGMNTYVMADEKMAILATDNLDNTYLGFSCVNAGTYTVKFGNLQGKVLTLIDLNNNTEITMDENTEYQFYAEANTTEDYRFKVVSPRVTPTDMETINAAKAVKKGIFTMTGQYMGEMNNWHSLPSGMYLVNGERKIK